MATTTQLSKWGNSLGLRLPKSVAREVQLGEGDTVQVSVDNGTIVIRPSRPRYSLDEARPPYHSEEPTRRERLGRSARG